MSLITFIITTIGFLAVIALITTIPLRRKKVLSTAGKLLLPLQNGVSYKVIALFLLSILVLIVIPLRNFAVYIQAIFAAVAVFAARMAAQEATGLKLAGIYENMIISGTYIVTFDNILSLPTLAYEDDPETYGVDKTTLEIIREKDAASILLIFENEEKRQEAVKTILKIRPELKVENEK